MQTRETSGISPIATVVATSLTTILLMSLFNQPKKIDPELKRRLEEEENKLDSSLTEQQKIAALTKIVKTQNAIIKDESARGPNVSGAAAIIGGGFLWLNSNYKIEYDKENGLSVKERSCTIL